MPAGPRVHYSAFDVVPSSKGASTHITAFVRGLARAGADVELITVADGKLPEESEYAGARAHRVRRVHAETFLGRALEFGDAVSERLERHGPRSFALCHFRNAWCGLPIVEAAGKLGYRTLFEVNGLPSVELRYHYPALRGTATLERIRQREILTLLQADAVVCPSRVTAAFLESLGVERERVSVIPNGMDPALFQVTPLPPERVVRHMLYVGTLADWQGLLVLLHALAKIVSQAEVLLHVIGSGRARQRRRLERWVTRLGLNGRVFLVEPVPHGEIPAWIARADVCVAPLGYNERNVTQGCCPLKIIEYMGVGRPVVAANLPVVRELFRDGIEGLLFEPDNAEDLAAKVLRVLEDRPLAERLGAAAGRRAHAALRWDTAQEGLLSLYDQLLGTSLANDFRAPPDAWIEQPERARYGAEGSRLQASIPAK